MALRGTKPTSADKRLKALFFGTPGAGKTTAAIQFPRPYLIDTERGAEREQYTRLLNEREGAYLFEPTFDGLLTEVNALLTEKHPYQTVIIDPLTVVYNEMVDRSAEANGTEFGRHKIEPDRKVKRLLHMLLRLDMNVIITSHAKGNWVQAKDSKGKDVAVQQGMTFDCYSKLEYLFDLVFEVGRRGKDRVGIVRKTRVESFAEGEVFPFSYDEIAAKYGRPQLERDSVPEELATREQAADADRLAKLLNIDGDMLDKWFTKAQAATWGEFSKANIEKAIAYMKSRVEQKEEVTK
jgi:hypothetical protein